MTQSNHAEVVDLIRGTLFSLWRTFLPSSFSRRREAKRAATFFFRSDVDGIPFFFFFFQNFCKIPTPKSGEKITGLPVDGSLFSP